MSFLLKFVIGIALLYLALCLLLYLLQENIIFLSQKLPANYQFVFQNHKEVFLENNELDNGLIHALHFFTPQPRPRGVILYFHGNAGNLAGWGQLGKEFNDLGYDLLMPDYRGYGKSTGKLSQSALFSDALLCYNYLKQHYATKDIIIYGRSLGTGIATYLASQVQAKLLILETPFYSLDHIARSYFPFLPIHLLNRYPLPSHKHLQQVACPIYIFHGLQDEIVSYASAKKLYESLEGKKVEMISIPHGNHNNLGQFDKYQEGLKRILADK